MLSITKFAAVAAAVFTVSAPAFAAEIPDGTVAISALGSPTLDATGTVSYSNVATFQFSGTGGFFTANSLFGALNGTLSFSTAVGGVVANSISDFFVFNDGLGGTFNFSLASVQTMSYSVTPGVSESVGLYLLGSTVDATVPYDATLTSITLTINTTGNSAASSSGTLAVPPAPVPEAATWVMMVAGFGFVGLGLRSRRSTSVSFG